MTGKDLLNGLNFLDDDLIEETGKENLEDFSGEEKKDQITSAESLKSGHKKKRNHPYLIQTVVLAAAGLCIFIAGTAVGRKQIRPLSDDQTNIRETPEIQTQEIQPQDGTALMGAFLESDTVEGVNEMLPQENSGQAQAENETIITLSSIKVGNSPDAKLANVIGDINVFFYTEDTDGTNQFLADFTKDKVSYTLRADTLKGVVQAVADVICGTNVAIIEN